MKLEKKRAVGKMRTKTASVRMLSLGISAEWKGRRAGRGFLEWIGAGGDSLRAEWAVLMSQPAFWLWEMRKWKHRGDRECTAVWAVPARAAVLWGPGRASDKTQCRQIGLHLACEFSVWSSFIVSPFFHVFNCYNLLIGKSLYSIMLYNINLYIY